MKHNFIPFFLLMCACGGSNITSSTDGDVNDTENTDVEESNPEESIEEESNTEEESEPVEEIEEEEPQDIPADFLLESGIWSVAAATLSEDTCDWDAQMVQFLGVGTDALLPKDFTVAGFEGSFEIEANAYGAAGPILCTLNGSEFDCETQSVTPVDFDLGTYGWTYAIEFSGVVSDANSLEGTAFVSFPTVSEYLLPVFEAVGVDVSQCTQTYELSLRHDI